MEPGESRIQPVRLEVYDKISMQKMHCTKVGFSRQIF
jgi:hypothetical protein